MIEPRINLYSDTQTRPTPEMRRAMAEAEVGDEQHFHDPTVNRLCEMVAELLGKEAAVFLPSGTMCNEIAILVHCRPGDEIYCHRTAHILNFEAGGPSALAGAVMHPLDGERGRYSPEGLAAAIRPDGRYGPRARLVAVEQTANMPGGTVWPVAQIDAVCRVAREHGLATHMDGARLMNAVVASGSPAAAHCAGFDSAWIDLSKGLGCPMGGVLAGSRSFVDEAWRWKQRIGGALRQAGIVAAAGVYALEHNVERLADDHANARRFAELVAQSPDVALTPPDIDTNMVFVDVRATGVGAPALAERLGERGVFIGALDDTTLRAVTHLDVDRAAVEEAAALFAQTVEELRTG